MTRTFTAAEMLAEAEIMDTFAVGLREQGAPSLAENRERTAAMLRQAASGGPRIWRCFCQDPNKCECLRQAAAGPKRCGEGPCKWFDTGENHNGEIRGWCSKHDDDNPICVPADGSGFCHLHEAKP